MQRDVAVLSLSRVGVEYKGLLFPRVWDGAKGIEQSTYKVVSSQDRPLSNVSVNDKIMIPFKTLMIIRTPENMLRLDLQANKKLAFTLMFLFCSK